MPPHPHLLHLEFFISSKCKQTVPLGSHKNKPTKYKIDDYDIHNAMSDRFFFGERVGVQKILVHITKKFLLSLLKNEFHDIDADVKGSSDI